MFHERRHTFVNDLEQFESVVKRMDTNKMSPLIDDRIKHLVAKRQYDAARKLARLYPDDPTAQQYLRDIDALETPAERGAKSIMKYLAYAALVVLVIAIGVVVFTLITLK